MKIIDLAEEDRPREKMARIGAENLTNSELLAILIGSGSVNESAVDLLKRLGRLSFNELMNYRGIGEAKAVTIMAACELGKRRQQEQAEERQDLGSATAIYNFMHARMQDLDVEEAWALLMNQNYKLIKAFRISHGGISETAVDVRVVMREALLNNTTILALCHNHPSNSTSPSTADDRLTQTVKKACETMRIHFLDHIIITDGRYYSYHEEGRLV